LGLHGLKLGFAWLQTQDKPVKSGGLLFAASQKPFAQIESVFFFG
jgi:hypothetical protein